MRAVDTNVLARALVRDHPAQALVADSVLRDGAFVPITVMLETGWLLGSRYGFSRQVVADMLLTVTTFPAVIVEQEDAVRWALERYAVAGDLADLMHLAAARRSTAFATFDRRLARGAGDAPPLPVETLA